MLPGFNSDIDVAGVPYHVQTEDWGVENPYIVSRVYCNGAVIKSIKTPYSEVLYSNYMIDPDEIKLALRRQHQKILDLLYSGHLF